METYNVTVINAYRQGFSSSEINNDMPLRHIKYLMKDNNDLSFYFLVGSVRYEGVTLESFLASFHGITDFSIFFYNSDAVELAVGQTFEHKNGSISILAVRGEGKISASVVSWGWTEKKVLTIGQVKEVANVFIKA